MASPLRLIVCAAAGRMGAQVAALAGADRRFQIVATILKSTPAEAFQDALARADALIDCSTPAASLSFASAAARAKKAAVIGTTGFSPSQRRALKTLARRAPLFVAPNFSLGVAVLRRLAADAARQLRGYEAGLVEIHHSAKRDAPSGTALALMKSVEDARGDGRRVPAVSQRLGDVIGEHTLTFAGPFERLELTHRAHSRALFAQGALEAALWLKGKKPGLYGMDDMLDAR